MLRKKILLCILNGLLAILFLVSSGLAFTITSPFGWRTHPITKKWRFHTGIDIGLEYGTPIPALFDGQVVWAQSFKGYGNTVLINHGHQTFTLYGHCSRILVVYGQTVKAGQIIAEVGSTGISTGPHLHLEYWVNNRYVDPMVIWHNNRQNKTVEPDEK